jgi:hypothetical protein
LNTSGLIQHPHIRSFHQVVNAIYQQANNTSWKLNLGQ